MSSKETKDISNNTSKMRVVKEVRDKQRNEECKNYNARNIGIDNSNKSNEICTRND